VLGIVEGNMKMVDYGQCIDRIEMYRDKLL